MTDIGDMDNSEGVDEFVDALIEGQIMATLVHNLQRLDETQKQEADGVHNTLGMNRGYLRNDSWFTVVRRKVDHLVLKKFHLT